MNSNETADLIFIFNVFNMRWMKENNVVAYKINCIANLKMIQQNLSLNILKKPFALKKEKLWKWEAQIKN